jgi:hypothetical protein
LYRVHVESRRAGGCDAWPLRPKPPPSAVRRSTSEAAKRAGMARPTTSRVPALPPITPIGGGETGRGAYGAPPEAATPTRQDPERAV